MRRIGLLALSGVLAAAGTPAWSQPAQPSEEPAGESAPGAAKREIKLNLSEAERRALESNLLLAVQRAEPGIQAAVEGQARGAFDPILFASASFERRETPVASTVQAAFGSPSQIDENEWQYSSGLSGILPFGLSYQSTYLMTRLDSNSGFNSLRPEFRPVWVSSLKLPLLRDLVQNEANIAVRRSILGRQIAEETFRQQIQDTLVSVDTAYWNLSAARANLQVAQKSLQRAQELLQRSRVQYEVGTVSKVAVSQALAGEAARDFDRIAADAAAELAQDRLLDLIGRPTLEDYESLRIATEEPAFVEYALDEEAAAKRALERRPELALRRKAVTDAELNLGLAENQTLPRLDLTASYTLQGLAGNQKSDPGASAGFGVNPAFDPNSPVSAANNPIRQNFIPKLGVPDEGKSAHSKFFKAGGNRGWSLGGRIEFPLGNHVARERETQARIELRRARFELARQRQTVLLEVRDATRNLRSAILGIRAAERRRASAEETLRAEQERLRLGDSTPFDVLLREEDVADAQRQQIGALETYRNSITGLERAQGTLLEARGVRFEEELAR
ncbi:MAG: TolC family protein [Myxococcota bacterium]